METINPVGGSGTTEGRDGWCTPRWVADLIGPVDLDPCSNERSWIGATWKLAQEYGADGLYGQSQGWFRLGDGRELYAAPHWRVFVNCPYARGQVVRWVRHYAHTNFLFLLRWAPDTEWFRELEPKCWGFWFPNVRINFEPPPGVASSSNPFPHALYLAKEPTGDFLDRLLANGYLVRNERQYRRISGRGPAYPSPQGGIGGSGGSAVWPRTGCPACDAAAKGYLVLCATHHPPPRSPGCAAGGEGPGS